MNHSVWAGALALMLLGQQQTTPQQANPATPQQAIPDAPRPQTTIPKIPSVGPATIEDSSSDAPAAQPAVPTTLPSTPSAPAQAPAAAGQEAPSSDLSAFTIRVPVNYVQVPFTVKDSKGNLYPGLTSHDVQIFENNVLQHMVLFSAGDPQPLSLALVIDQSLPPDLMAKVNNSVDAIPGAFAPYDEVAVFTYNNGPKEQTTFTASQSARLTAVLDLTKLWHGREPSMAMGGPLAQNQYLNGGANVHIDPNSNGSNGTSLSGIQNEPPEVHTLNDAIYAAAKELATKTAPGRRRVIYVISDGKEYGSQAKQKDVIKYLETNNITVYATLVEVVETPGLGWLDRVHVPLTMRDDILPSYANATGGEIDREWRSGGMERSFAKLAEEVRTQYIAGYITHESMLDSEFRPITVVVKRPNVTITVEKGYYPTAPQNRAPMPPSAPAP